jgi:hypothetical protein
MFRRLIKFREKPHLEKTSTIELSTKVDQQLELTEQHLAELFTASFAHSQGSIPLQKDIFYYIHHKFPSYTISSDMYLKLTHSHTLRSKFAEKTLGVHDGHISTDLATQTDAHKENQLTMADVFFQIEKRLEDFQNALDCTEEYKREACLREILNRMIEKDHKNITQRRRNFSYVVTHGLYETSTGLKELDLLYSELNLIIKKVLDTNNVSLEITPEHYAQLIYICEQFTATSLVRKKRIPENTRE